MITSVPDVSQLIERMEDNAPDVYAKCSADLVDKKGKTKRKKCIINLKTGDVFKNRALTFAESSNFRLVRRYDHRSKDVDAHIEHYAYQCASVVEGNVVLATWVFGDHYNYPKTTRIEWSWYGDYLLPRTRPGTKVDESALFNVRVSKPKIASIVMITQNKDVFSWDNIENYGLMKPMYGNSENTYLSCSLMNALRYSYDGKRVVGLTESFKKAFMVGYLGANKYIVFDSYKDISAFMKAPKLEKKLSPNQSRIDNLLAIDLPDHSIVSAYENTICYADKLDSEWTVLRWYRKLMPAQYLETTRMYVNKTEALHCRNNLRGDWVHAGAKIKSETFNAERIVLQSDDVFDGTKLEYFKNVSAEVGNQSAALYMLTMYPEFEKMCKAGLQWLCEAYLASPYQMSWKHYLEESVRDVDWKAKNILKMIGVNRHQVDKLSDFRKKIECHAQPSSWQKRCMNNIIHKLKAIFGVSSLSSIDNATFDYILDSLSDLDRLLGCYSSCLTITFDMYHNDAMYFIKDLNAAMAEKQFVSTTTANGYRSQMSVDRLYLDLMRMIQSGGYTDVLRPRFSSVDELLGHHNVMVDLINANQVEHEARMVAQYNMSFASNLTRWQKLEWDEDNEFCIVAPTQPIDIAIEGITLRHCVKSYIPAIAAGKTNVLFIRQKGKESEPFFTVEVDLRNNIRQVHGMCNANASSVNGLTDFVKRWSKAKKLKYSQEFANGVRAVG